MAKHFLVVLVALALLAAAPLALAQDKPEPEEKVFNLIVGDENAKVIEEEVDETPRYEPRIEPGRWSVTLTLGYVGSGGTMFEHDNIIYKATSEAFYYGDVKIKSASAFNPIFRIGHNLTSWFAIEGQFGLAFGEYTADISNPYSVDPFGLESPVRVTELGTFDRENRSVLMGTGNLNGVFFPFNLDGDGRGRWHPYLTGGVGYALYNIDSDYTDDPAGGLNVNAGLGLMLIADDLITMRVEFLYQVHTIEFKPGKFFQQRDAGTVTVPVYEFTDFGQYREVESFSSHTLSNLAWQIGFQLGF
ncbi:MAG: hypothetical protein R3D98_16750 [Candidatus Krumholzibacteriia bacterium]